MGCFLGFHDWRVNRHSDNFFCLGTCKEKWELVLTPEEVKDIDSEGLIDYLFSEDRYKGRPQYKMFCDKKLEDKICRKCEKIVLQVDDYIEEWKLKKRKEKQEADRLLKLENALADRLENYRRLRKLAKSKKKGIK